MADEKVEPREINWRQLLPWTAIFQGFRVALDLNKLLLAALGILLMALAWWFLAWLFYAAYTKPLAGNYSPENFARFKADRHVWNLMYEAAGPADAKETLEPDDLADSADELNLIKLAVSAVTGEAARGRSSRILRPTPELAGLSSKDSTGRGKRTSFRFPRMSRQRLGSSAIRR